MGKIKTHVLIEDAIDALRIMQLSESTLRDYRTKSFAQIRKYHEQRKTQYFSEVLTAKFVDFQQTRLRANLISDRHFRNIRKGARVLVEVYQTGKLIWNAPGRMRLPSTQPFGQIFESFLISLARVSQLQTLILQEA